jgi:hypothetical protein
MYFAAQDPSRNYEDSVTSESSDAVEPVRDFFISYTGSDRAWAEWIAQQLEEAGYTTILQAWDFVPGSHFVNEMHRAMQIARRTIAVLSSVYTESSFATAEWQEAWRQDPSGDSQKLLVFRVENCSRPGLLAQVVSEDLFGVDAETARSRLLAAVRSGRRKPDIPTGFPPVREAPINTALFPGQLVPADPDDAMAAMGPMTFDNPSAVAFGFWHAALNDDTDGVELFITPESRGQWSLSDIRNATEDSGITSAVVKPCYDVAYVRIVSELAPEDPDVAKVAGGLVPMEARIISMVLRPELGGWRVHNFGYPQDPDALPRTWVPPEGAQ